MGIRDFFDSFGSVNVWEQDGVVAITGINVKDFLADVYDIWINKKLPILMFRDVEYYKYRLVFNSFFVPDVIYQLEQIITLKKRKSSKYRLESAHKQLFTETWYKSTTEKHPDILDFTQLNRLKFKLLPTQMETMRVYNEKVPKMQIKGFLLGTPAGSGKTLMSIALSVMLHADIVIFVVPRSTVTTVWYDGIIEQFGDKVSVWSSVSGKPLTEDYQYYIVHYEALDKIIEFAKSIRGKRHRPFIASDECHNLNEISSERTRRFVELSKILNCQHTVFASGTPIKALGSEMIPLLQTIDRYFTPEAEIRFSKIYGATAKRANDILRNRLGLISHKIIESDYMKIPPPIEMEYPITIPKYDRFLIDNIKKDMKIFMMERYQYYQKNMRSYTTIYDEGINYYERTIRTNAEYKELKQYREYIRTIIKGYDPVEHKDIAKFVKTVEIEKIIPSLPQPLKNKFKDALSVVKWARLRVLGEMLGQIAKRRAECAVEIAKYGRFEDIVTKADKKTIIFSSFIPALVAANEHLVNKGFNTLQVYGDFTKKLTEIVNQFKKDPDTNPLIATLQSLAASQTLVVANTVIFIDAPFRNHIFDQAFHRIFRIGQDCQTYIIMCKLSTKEPNISDRSADILAWSKNQAEEIFGTAAPEDISGIVRRLKLNPPASGSEQLFEMIKNIFGA